jgi:predicted DNA-binding transcriptional regulator AlpA
MTQNEKPKSKRPPTDAEVLYTDEVAALLRCSRQFLHRAWNAGKFPEPRRLGSRPYWTRADLEPLLGPRSAE